MRFSRIVMLVIGIASLATVATAAPVTLILRPLAVDFPQIAGKVTIDCDVHSTPEVLVRVQNLPAGDYLLVMEKGNGERTTIGEMPVPNSREVSFMFRPALCPLTGFMKIMVMNRSTFVLSADLPR